MVLEGSPRRTVLDPISWKNVEKGCREVTSGLFWRDATILILEYRLLYF